MHGKRADADRTLRRMLREVEAGRWSDPARITVAEFAADWLHHIEGTIEPSTLRSYESHILIRIAPSIGAIRLNQVTGRRLSTMYRDIQQDRDITVSTIRRIHATIRRMLHYAVKWEHLPTNPARYADLPKATDRREQIHVWEPEQLHQFFNDIRDDRWWTLYALLATTGMRRGEALGLTWDNIDLDQAHVDIQHQRTDDGVKALKTSSARWRIMLPDQTTAALRTWRKHTLEERLLLGDIYQDTALVFVWPTGRAPDPGYISKHFTRTITRLGLPRIRLHDLKHTHATELLQQGSQPSKTVSERLGHAGIHITLDTYTHLVPELHRQAAEAAGAMLPSEIVETFR